MEPRSGEDYGQARIILARWVRGVSFHRGTTVAIAVLQSAREVLRLSPAFSSIWNAIDLSVEDVTGAQHHRFLVRGQIRNPSGPATIGDLVMDVYTGWLVFTYERDDPGIIQVLSFVPLGTGSGANLDLQGYPGGASAAIVSASMSSFADDPELAAVDTAKVKLATANFQGLPPAQVLVLDVSIAVTEGRFHRVAYRVTVLAAAKEPSRPLAELAASVVSVNRSTRLPDDFPLLS
jgi:hypothetical protein